LGEVGEVGEMEVGVVVVDVRIGDAGMGVPLVGDCWLELDVAGIVSNEGLLPDGPGSG
jgi:hypothetical protein